MKSLKLLGIAALALVFSACGGKSISSKQEAAEAFNRVMTASNSAQSGSNASKFGSFDMELDVSGKQGKAHLKYTLSASGQDASILYTITYTDFSADGENVFNGTMTYKVNATGNETGGTVNVVMKGKVEMTGEYDSTLDFDMTVSTSATSLSSGGGQVSMTMTGYISADGSKYEYANESITVTAHGD